MNWPEIHQENLQTKTVMDLVTNSSNFMLTICMTAKLYTTNGLQDIITGLKDSSPRHRHTTNCTVPEQLNSEANYELCYQTSAKNASQCRIYICGALGPMYLLTNEK